MTTGWIAPRWVPVMIYCVALGGSDTVRPRSAVLILPSACMASRMAASVRSSADR